MTGLVLFRLRQPTSFPLWGMKVFASALSPFLLLFGLLAAAIGWALDNPLLLILGVLGAALYAVHVRSVTQPPEAATDLDAAFGAQWADRIPAERKTRFLSKRYVIRLPKAPDPVLEQDQVFHTIPDTDRQLLCDIWQPPETVQRSGLVFLYLHGSAWTLFDKDYGTRPFFRHLANQGHVVMDIAYRLFPETDLMGMVHDAKHAIAWIKANAAAYQVDPSRILIGGGSAGGHVALLAAYTDQDERFLPPDLADQDLSVRGVLSLYGPTDLKATYYHTAQHITGSSAKGKKPKTDEEEGTPPWLRKRMGENFHRLGFDKKVEPGMLEGILGVTPEDDPERYALFSPVTHADAACPPTLQISGRHDIIIPEEGVRRLHLRLAEAGVPAALHMVPQVDHAFDLILPKTSPSAHNAYYDLERFLALMV